jgi:DNA-binding MarR family transcriptional regulator
MADREHGRPGYPQTRADQPFVRGNNRLITRTVSTADRRRFDVSLTPPGRRRFEQVWPGHADGIGRYFAQPLTARDIEDLARILDTLIQANQNHHQPR